MSAISFFVPGEPKTKARAGHSSPFMKSDGKLGIRNFKDDKTAAYEATVKHYALEVAPEAPFDCAVSLTIKFVFLKPKSVPKKRIYPSVKPDLDNLEKAVMDAMNKLIYTDDAKICFKRTWKEYTDDARKEGVQVEIATVG